MHLIANEARSFFQKSFKAVAILIDGTTKKKNGKKKSKKHASSRVSSSEMAGLKKRILEAKSPMMRLKKFLTQRTRIYFQHTKFV